MAGENNDSVHYCFVPYGTEGVYTYITIFIFNYKTNTLQFNLYTVEYSLNKCRFFSAFILDPYC